MNNRNDFVNWLEKKGIPHCEYTENGLDQVYVFSKKEYEMKQKHPRKNKDLYVPQLRVSQFDGWPDLYVKDNGYCEYMNIQDIVRQCIHEYM
jgi:hypothetical protein